MSIKVKASSNIAHIENSQCNLICFLFTDQRKFWTLLRCLEIQYLYCWSSWDFTNAS